MKRQENRAKLVRGVEDEEIVSISDRKGYVILEEQYSVTLTEHMTMEELLEVGNYDVHMGDLTEMQRMFNADPTTCDTVLELMSFEHSCAIEHMYAVMEKEGYRPATLRELLALGAQYPNLQRQRILVALGSVNRAMYIKQGVTEWSLGNALQIPALTDFLGERTLLLGEYDGKYRPGYCFLCVKC